ncbi:MAG: glycoside hydrolase family 127 protein [Bacteroidetes bacterium]|nr:glycoside hydrolase family 127 protein [Bacteroidota bacterium]
MMKNTFIAVLLGMTCAAGSAAAQSYAAERNNPRIKVKPVAPMAAYAFNLADVRLLDGSPFKNAMDRDAGYLLFLDPERLLHRFYTNAGLPANAPVYGGWESEGLSGHTLGHYLSACSMMYASTGDIRFKQKVDYIADALQRCQQARKTGYVGAIPNEDSIFGKVARGEIKTGGFDLNGGWSPWYTVHKVMAGLEDAYMHCGSQKALTIVCGMADWTEQTLKNLTPAQLQQMLRCEYGGMNDVLANLYALTGNKKYLDLSYKFFDDFVMKPLSEKTDPMPGRHSNTNVPKAIGSAAQYELTGNERDSTIASFFWHTMVQHHSYVIGGNSNYEYCGDEDKLNDRLSDNTCETCNTYNMLKLTRHLFEWRPSAAYGDYYERALYNHILASQNPETGMMCYFVPLRMGTRKTFSDSVHTFTCCVGSGMENHAKYTEGIYYRGQDGSLYVNLFIPSELSWKERQLKLLQQTRFPESNCTEMTIQAQRPQHFSLRIRKPGWTGKTYSIMVNGASIKSRLDSNGFIEVNRIWKMNDKISISWSMQLHTESMPDNPGRVAFLYGPIVLAGLLGDKQPDPVYGVPVLLTDNREVADWIKPGSEPLQFATTQTGKPFDVTLQPFYKTYKQYYSVYWDFFTPAQWTARQSAYEAEKKHQKEIEEKTIDFFRIGEMQPERDHNLVAGERSYVSDAMGVNGREARKGSFFSFELKVQPEVANSLLLTYIGDDKDRKFDIVVDGQKLATEDWQGGTTGKFYTKTYLLPAALLAGKSKLTVRIEANYDKTAGRVFGARTIRE